MTETYGAANGLLSRRHLLKAGAATLALPVMADEAWRQTPGQPTSAYGEPSRFARLQRERVNAHPYGTCGRVVINASAIHERNHYSQQPAFRKTS